MIRNPTRRTYTVIDAAYDHFNEELFAGELPDCLITFQRHKGAYGFFVGDRFAKMDDPGEITDEIALNPAGFAGRTSTEVLSTLVHEMVHLWQHHFGKPSRKCYHNREWAGKMLQVGLVPSNTGEPGGKQTGQHVSHFIEKGGRFAVACQAFLKSESGALYQDQAQTEDEARTRSAKSASKTKFTCPGCELNAWAKPGAKLVCGECEELMTPEERDD